MNVLVLNCGSSSLKFQVVATDAAAIERGADRMLARGLVERIGSEALLTFTAGDGGTAVETAAKVDIDQVRVPGRARRKAAQKHDEPDAPEYEAPARAEPTGAYFLINPARRAYNRAPADAHRPGLTQ